VAISYRVPVLHLHKGTMEDWMAIVLKKMVPADMVAVSGDYYLLGTGTTFAQGHN
jgi:hypothetical protein